MKCACPETARKRYRHVVAVQSPSGTAGASGHVDLTDDANWTSSGNIKANFITKGSREGRIFDQVQAEVSHVIETPSTALSRSIHPEDRVVFDGRKFQVTAAYDVNEERREVQIHLTEVV